MDNYNSKHPCIQQKYICSMMNFMVVFISFFIIKNFIPWELLQYVGQFRNLIIKLVLRANRFKNLPQLYVMLVCS
jgi:uncharacterized membrane-anchored protein